MKRYVLQRKLTGDAGKWRSVFPFLERDNMRVNVLVRTIAHIAAAPVIFRVVVDDDRQAEVARFDGSDWRVVEAAR